MGDRGWVWLAADKAQTVRGLNVGIDDVEPVPPAAIAAQAPGRVAKNAHGLTGAIVGKGDVPPQCERTRSSQVCSDTFSVVDRT